MFFNYSSFRLNFQTKKAGFTIYPLVLVIIIISVSFSYFTPFYAKQKLGIVAEEVISQTNYLRFRALIDQILIFPMILIAQAKFFFILMAEPALELFPYN